jgi:hypothetical protein
MVAPNRAGDNAGGSQRAAISPRYKQNPIVATLFASTNAALGGSSLCRGPEPPEEAPGSPPIPHHMPLPSNRWPIVGVPNPAARRLAFCAQPAADSSAISARQSGVKR